MNARAVGYIFGAEVADDAGRDPETGQRYTVKRYESEKAKRGDSWRHERITLKPVNPDFEPIVLTETVEGQVNVVAELVEVLSTREKAGRREL